MVCSQILSYLFCLSFFFFNDTATTEIYTLSLHDALPIFNVENSNAFISGATHHRNGQIPPVIKRSEEHTSELQSHSDLVCRLLLEKKKKKTNKITCHTIHTTTKTIMDPHSCKPKATLTRL